MTIITTTIPVSLLNYECDIYVMPISENQLRKVNETECFLLYDKGVVFSANVSKHFDNIETVNELPTIGPDDTLILISKTANGLVFTHLVLNME